MSVMGLLQAKTESFNLSAWSLCDTQSIWGPFFAPPPDTH